MTEWLRALAAHEQAGRPAVLVTVLAVEGSAPREAGCKMVVAADAIAGTIGGGQLELAAIEAARGILRAGGGSPRLVDYPLGPSLGQCCGGKVSLLYEAILPPALQVGLFGAGHVGRALVKLLGDLPCRVTWIDSRPGAFPAALPANVTTLASALPVHEVALLPGRAAVLVMTHDHGLDLELVDAALRRPFPFVGMIGSATKRARFLRRLAQRGLGPEALARFTCPIGLPGIGGKHPAEIAVAVAAQLLSLAPVPAAAEA